MNKSYKCKNGIIDVELPESCDRSKLIHITEDFMKKVLKGVNKYGNSNSSGNFRKK